MNTNKLVITKVGTNEEPAGAPQPIKGYIPAPVPYPLQGGVKHKNFPKSILKKTARIRGVRNPTAPPPFKKSHTRKHTIRLITLKGNTRRIKTIKNKVKGMTKSELLEKAEKNKFLVNKDSPTYLLRSLVEGGMIAGMIS